MQLLHSSSSLLQTAIGTERRVHQQQQRAHATRLKEVAGFRRPDIGILRGQKNCVSVLAKYVCVVDGRSVDSLACKRYQSDFQRKSAAYLGRSNYFSCG